METKTLTPAVKGSNLIQQNYITEEGLDIVNRHISLFKQFIQSQMVEGVDYGYITNKEGKPISDKPTLFKSGAEKLAMLFSFSPMYEVDKYEDWDKGIFRYEVKCSLISRKTGEVIAEGHGIAHSKERKYRSNKVDPFDLPNTLLKMAKKRAFVDAVLLATGGSFFFTQDLEDTTEPIQTDNSNNISEAQIRKISVLVKELGWSEEQFKNWLKKAAKVESRKDLTKSQASKIIDYLQKQLDEKKKQEPEIEEPEVQEVSDDDVPF
ncbi:hypothetical protein [Persephonella sp.]|uniref:hypothetical protein n=1 Tax=Persephonella sp. TaxID=2060922 RepID=UPI00261EE83B|nr:hypothetical protein [Persephonella sp.]